MTKFYYGNQKLGKNLLNRIILNKILIYDIFRTNIAIS